MSRGKGGERQEDRTVQEGLPGREKRGEREKVRLSEEEGTAPMPEDSHPDE